MGLDVRSTVIRADDRPSLDGVVPLATMVGPIRRDGPLARGLDQETARIRAHARLEAELHSIAVDLLGPNEADEFPGACADWVGKMTEAVVPRVSDEALETLIRGIDASCVRVPSDVARHLDRARARRDAGFD